MSEAREADLDGQIHSLLNRLDNLRDGLLALVPAPQPAYIPDTALAQVRDYIADLTARLDAAEAEVERLKAENKNGARILADFERRLEKQQAATIKAEKEIARLRSLPTPHDESYGPCDGLGTNGLCSVCEQAFRERDEFRSALTAATERADGLQAEQARIVELLDEQGIDALHALNGKILSPSERLSVCLARLRADRERIAEAVKARVIETIDAAAKRLQAGHNASSSAYQFGFADGHTQAATLISRLEVAVIIAAAERQGEQKPFLTCSTCGGHTAPMRRDNRNQIACNTCFERWRFIDADKYWEWRIIDAPPVEASDAAERKG